MHTESTTFSGSSESGRFQARGASIDSIRLVFVDLETSSTAMLGRFRPSHPIHRHELEREGIWDIDRHAPFKFQPSHPWCFRLCEPHITTALLEQEFGDLAPDISARYLTEDDQHFLHLRAAFNTEKKIQSVKPRHSIQLLESETELVKRGLLKCVQNVILLRHPTDANVFYPVYLTACFVTVIVSCRSLI